MADLDTAAKRISGANVGNVWRGLGYFPTGTVDGPERLAFGFLYSGITAGTPTPTPTPTPTVTPAGKSRKHRYFVEVDGETFEAENASHALAILDRALELAPKAAEEAAEEVEHKLARHNVARRIGLATPKIATDAPINLEPFRTRLKQVYRNAAVEAELRLHMAMLAKLEEEDEDRAAEILLLH